MTTSTRSPLSSARRFALALASALAVAACGAGGGSQTASPATPSYPAAVEKGSTLKIYTWADYISPDNIKAFESATGVTVQVDAYASSEEALAKLRLTQGTSGYDLLVIDGSYVPQLVKNEALLPWDKARLPGLSGMSSAFLGRNWDPTNTYAIPKSGGSTGWVWDSAVVPTPPTTWNEFYGHFADPAVKGKTSVIDGAPSFISSYFWGNGISDQTTNSDDYAAAETYFSATVLPHLKAFNSYPRADLAAGTYALAQAFTGDARGALIDGPKTLRFALGAPKTDIYVDHWTLPKGSANPAAAHAFVAWMLDPEHAATETLFHGYFTGVTASKQYMPKDTPYLDVIFFDEGVPADRFEPAAVTDARKLSVASFERLKALASR